MRGQKDVSDLNVYAQYYPCEKIFKDLFKVLKELLQILEDNQRSIKEPNLLKLNTKIIKEILRLFQGFCTDPENK